MILNVVVLAVSQKWQDEQLVREALRKVHTANPRATVRMPASPSGAAREARDFALALELSVEEWPLQSWAKYASEIRNKGMCHGRIWDPERKGEVLEVRPRADLVMAFWTGNADTVKDVFQAQLHGGDPVVIYRENWSKSKHTEKKMSGVSRSENDKRKRTKLKEWRKL